MIPRYRTMGGPKVTEMQLQMDYPVFGQGFLVSALNTGSLVWRTRQIHSGRQNVLLIKFGTAPASNTALIANMVVICLPTVARSFCSIY